jgi:hypothetical protein
MSLRQRRRLGLMAEQIRDSDELLPEIREYLVGVFGQIAEGSDANVALGLSRGKGDKELNEVFKLNLAKIFHWIMSAKRPEPDGYGLNLTQAFEAASALSYGKSWKHPKKGFVLPPQSPGFFRPITANSLCSAWYNKNYKHFQTLDIDYGSFDFPYQDPRS